MSLITHTHIRMMVYNYGSNESTWSDMMTWNDIVYIKCHHFRSGPRWVTSALDAWTLRFCSSKDDLKSPCLSHGEPQSSKLFGLWFVVPPWQKHANYRSVEKFLLVHVGLSWHFQGLYHAIPRKCVMFNGKQNNHWIYGYPTCSNKAIRIACGIMSLCRGKE